MSHPDEDAVLVLHHGAQYLRDGDVVALEFTGLAGVVPFTVGGDPGG